MTNNLTLLCLVFFQLRLTTVPDKLIASRQTNTKGFLLQVTIVACYLTNYHENRIPDKQGRQGDRRLEVDNREQAGWPAKPG